MRTLCVLLLLVPTLGFAGTLYRWTDDVGGVHFTDDASSIPSQYRPQAASIDLHESKPPPRMPAAQEKPQPKVQTPKEVTPSREVPPSDDDEYYYGFVDEDEGRTV